MKLFKIIVLLPGTVLIFVPGMLLASCGFRLSGPFQWEFYPAVLLFISGFYLAAWTVQLFVRQGHGTPAPWNPPLRLVVAGPYCHVRNPMISAVLMMLLGEVFLFHSPALLGWMVFFWIVNMFYIPLCEETGLKKRFSRDYELYCRNVPRWIPRLTAWHLPSPPALK